MELLIVYMITDGTPIGKYYPHNKLN